MFLLMNKCKIPSRISNKITIDEYNLLKNLVDNTRDIIQTLTPEGNFIFVNNAWYKTLGYTKSDLSSITLKDIIHPDSKNHCMNVFNKIMTSKNSVFFETSLLTKKGEKILVEGSIHCILKKNKVLYVQCIMRDISEKKIYWEIIEHAINEWRITFDSMPCGVLLLDLDCIIKRANRYFVDLFKLPIEEVKGLKCEDIIKDEAFNNALKKITCERIIPIKTIEFNLSELNKSFLIDFTPVPGSDGITRSFILTFTDVSEIKDKEKKLQESKDAFFNMLKDLDYSYRELKGLFESLIRSFINVIEAKSPWTKGHSERVTNYAILIAKEFGLDNETINDLTIAALLHDIGKIGTYDIVLDNPNRLTEDELKLIYIHPIKGEDILKPIKQMKKILPIIRHHHERIDGNGYPDRLKGDEIPFLARILSVADAFDSMTSNRPYRNASTREYAISELENCKGTQFDSKIVDVFLKVLNKSNLTHVPD